MKVYLGTEHSSYEFKNKVKEYLEGLSHEVEDCGAHSYDPDDDYPDFIRPAAEGVASNPGTMGIIFGGSGQGEAMCANRVKGARAMVFYGPKEPAQAIDISGAKSSDTFELIKLGRIHNDANILSLGMRFMTEDEAKFAIELFLNTKFEGGERHSRRIKKLD